LRVVRRAVKRRSMAFDVDEVEALLIGAARAGQPLTYSEALAARSAIGSRGH